MKKRFLLIAATVMCLCVCSEAFANPFKVWPLQEEANWQSWGYAVDNQDWANWFAVTVPWGSEAAMSGSYRLDEDFLFWVDPDTSGLADPHSVYDADWFNHRDASGTRTYGLGEFFDAGSQASDRNYVLDLSLGAVDMWSVWYDADRDLVNDGGSEHPILGGTISSYWNENGYFYGVLSDADGKYNGFFTSSHNEGTPDLVVNGFHAGATGAPIPAPGALLLGSMGMGLVGWLRRRRAL